MKRDRLYSLSTAYIGELAPPEPWNNCIANQAEWINSFNFWATHALVYDPGVMGPVEKTTWAEVMNRAKERNGSKETPERSS